jgi:putative redox protein
MEVKTVWDSGMAFTAHQDGHVFVVDADESSGGQGRGPRPKGLLLSGLAGCTGMDVVSILQKMRVEVESLEILVDADLTDEHPKVFSRIHLKYVFRGKDLPQDKLEKAVNLSQERYCGVSAMLRQVCPLTWEIAASE